jgi:copper chaperone NosL
MVPFYCTDFCSALHQEMSGYIRVSPAGSLVLAGIDFYRWNYEYGHNLDPNAAIKVPGMAYQPPINRLYKQLLNFGAYSIPDIGGWMLITAGILLTILVIKEYRFQKK